MGLRPTLASLDTLETLSDDEREYVAAKRGTVPDDQLLDDIQQFRNINQANAKQAGDPVYGPDDAPDVESDGKPLSDAPSWEDFLSIAGPQNPRKPYRELRKYWNDTYGHLDPNTLPTLESWLPEAQAANPDRPEWKLVEYWKDEYGALGAPEKNLGVTGTILEGAKSAGRSLLATGQALLGDEHGAIETAKAQQAAPQDPALRAILEDIHKRKEALGKDPGWLESIKALGGAAFSHPKGAGLLFAEQLPNTGVALGSAAAGAAAGSFLGPVGTVAGGIAGLFLGNTALETGGKVLEAAGDQTFTPEERGQALKEGAIKGAVVTGVDVASLALTNFLVGTTARAVEKATIKTLTDAGVDVSDKAAIQAARQNPEIVARVTESATRAKAAVNTLGQRLTRGAGELASESIGEGAGEYLGEYAATGQGDKVEALIEAYAGLGQSAAEIAAAHAYTLAKRKDTIEAVPGQVGVGNPNVTIDETIRRADALMKQTTADLEAEDLATQERNAEAQAKVEEPLAPERTRTPFDVPILEGKQEAVPITNPPQAWMAEGLEPTSPTSPIIPGQAFTPRQTPEPDAREALAQERARLMAEREAALAQKRTPVSEPIQPEQLVTSQPEALVAPQTSPPVEPTATSSEAPIASAEPSPVTEPAPLVEPETPSQPETPVLEAQPATVSTGQPQPEPATTPETGTAPSYPEVFDKRELLASLERVLKDGQYRPYTPENRASLERRIAQLKEDLGGASGPGVEAPTFDYTTQSPKRPTVRQIISDWKKAGKPKDFSVEYGESYLRFYWGSAIGTGPSRWEDEGNWAGNIPIGKILEALKLEGQRPEQPGFRVQTPEENEAYGKEMQKQRAQEILSARKKPSAPRLAQEGSRYEGENLNDLLPTAEQEQRDRLKVIKALDHQLSRTPDMSGIKPGSRRHKQMEEELESLKDEYEGVYSEVADAAGQDEADAMRAKVEGTTPIQAEKQKTEAPKGPFDEQVKLLEQHPKLRQALKANREATPTVQSYRKEDGTYTPERRALHEKIIKDAIKPESIAKPGEQQAHIIIGMPGSGKTQVGRSTIKDAEKYTVVDADEIRIHLPEHTQILTSMTHEEASDIAQELIYRAGKANANLIYDGTGKNLEKLRRIITSLKTVGYRVSLTLVDLPTKEALKRAYGRFLRKNGRYTPLKFIAGLDSIPEKTYTELRGLTDEYARYDNNVPEGQPPRLLERSEPAPGLRGGVDRQGSGAAREGTPEPEEVAHVGQPTEPVGEKAPQSPEGTPSEGVHGTVGGGESERNGPEPSRSRGSRNERPAPERPPVQPSVRADQGSHLPSPRVDAEGSDYIISAEDHLEAGGPKAKFKKNADAIRLLKTLMAEGRLATPEEQAVLVKYTGWGGLKNAFTEDPAWTDEAKELRELLTDDEYETARRSIQYAHYTDPSTIGNMWAALRQLGFKKGSVLEPGMGTGNFFGAMPKALLKSVKRSGVEMDHISGNIAKQLYQRADIRIAPFQETTFPDNHFDVAIGNVPFSEVKIADEHDKELNRLGLSLHNYFFAKTLKKVRPGGVVAFITSRYTMDSTNAKARDYMASQADLIAAYRLPAGTFKGIANTEVTTDILLLQKRAPGAEQGGESWRKIEQHLQAGTEYSINEYFHTHPEHILGELSYQGTMYRENELTVKGDLTQAQKKLAELVKALPADTIKPYKAPKSTTQSGVAAALDEGEMTMELRNAKPDSYHVVEGKIYQKEGGRLVEYTPTKASVKERIIGLAGIRDAVNKVFGAQLRGAPDAILHRAQADLTKAYDSFVKKYGLINERANQWAYQQDPDYPVLQSLEKNYNAKEKTAEKADIFTKRTIEHRKVITSADSPASALSIVLNESNTVDFERMTALTGLDENALKTALKGVIYADPVTGDWETASAYLSGNVRQKLLEAEKAAKKNPTFQANVAALKLIQPKDLTPSQIDARLGAGWIPTEDMAAFIRSLFNTGHVTVRYSPAQGLWAISDFYGGYSVENTQTYGTSRMDGVRILEHGLNSQVPTIYDTTDDNKRVVNEKETLAAREKLSIIKEKFAKWIWTDDERATRLARYYNDHFNNTVEQKFDGSHLTIPGKHPAITLRPHQVNAVYRALQNHNTLLAHEVGTGKTFTMAAIAMEARRLGVAKKPMIVVPNHLVEQWGSEFRALFPSANVLLTKKEDFKKENRLKLMAKIATGDWDAVVVPFTSFTRLPISNDTFIGFMEEQIAILEEFIREEKQAQGKSGNRIVKDLEKAKERFENKIKNKKAAKESDNAVTFEQTGTDMLLVDEADLFKNLYFPTRMTRVSGLPNTESQRAFDMYMKTRYLTKLNNGRGVIFATGTPISNSMAEVFTMQCYLQQNTLEQAGLGHFDAWARAFGEAVSTIEMTASGKYAQKTRFAHFINVPELMQMFHQVMDVVRAEEANVERPPLKTGKPINITATPGPALKAYVASLSKRVDDLKGKDPREDNMLKITGDGRHAALDVRLRVPGAPEDKDSKVNKAVKQIAEIYHATAPFKGTQLVFLDLATPKAAAEKVNEDEAPAEGQENETKDEALERDGVYGMIRKKLIAKGVKPAEIAYIHDANTDARKKKLFDDVNDGKIRILLGSTEKMGAGMNVQKRLVALHDIDAPWRPRDLEQRHGRIIRFGNLLYFASKAIQRKDAGETLSDKDQEVLKEFKPHIEKLRNFEIEVYQYATEAPSFDVYMWQTLEAKAKMIAQAMKGDPTMRTIQDVDATSLSAAEMKALASGNPLVMEKIGVDADVRKYSMLRSAHQDSQFQMKRDISYNKSQITREEEDIAKAKKDVKTLADNPTEPFSIVVNGKTFKDKEKEAAGEAAIKAIEDFKRGEFAELGTYRGFALKGMALERRDFDRESGKQLTFLEYQIHAKANGLTYEANGKTGIGLMRSLDYALGKSEEEIPRLQKSILQRTKQIEGWEAELKKPFEHEERLNTLEARQKEIDKQLQPTEETQAKPEEGTVSASEEDVPEEFSSALVAVEEDKAAEYEEVEAGITGKNAYEAARWIEEHAPSSDYKLIARRLWQRISDMMDEGFQFNLHIAHLGDRVPLLLMGSRGLTATKYTTSDIWLNGADVKGKEGVTYEAVLHELLHAVTQVAIGVGRTRFANGKPLREHVRDLHAVSNAVVKHFNTRVKEGNLTEFEKKVSQGMNNALADPHEIVAWGLTNREMQAYLENIPYQRTSLWRGFVDAIRRFLGLPERAETALSEVLRITDALLDTPIQDLIEMSGKQAVLSALRDQPSGGVAREEQRSVDYFLPEMSKMDDVIRTLQDKNIDLARLTEAIKKAGGEVADDLNPVLKEELFLGRVAKHNQDFLTDELKPLVDQMRLNKVDIKTLDRYLHARHAKEANEYLASINPDREDNQALSGMTNEEAELILNEAPPVMARMAEKVDKIIAGTRKLMVDYGLESAERVKAWEDQYNHYVPLYREGFEQRLGTGQGRSIRGSTVRERTGSTRGVEDILAHIAMDREKIIVRGEKMRPVIALAGLLKQYPNKEIATLAKPTEITYHDPETGLEVTMPGDVGEYKVPMIKYVHEGKVEYRPDPAYKGRENVVNFRIEGKDHAIVFNESNERAMAMAHALKDLDVGQLNSLLSAVAPVTRYLASVNTQYNPVFGVINFIRDAQFAMLSLSSTPLSGKQKAIAANALSMMKGIYQDARAVRKGEHPSSSVAQLWERFQTVGGPTGYRDLFKTSADRAKAIQKMLDPDWWQKTTAGKIATAGGFLAKPEAALVNSIGRPIFEWLSDYNLTMENAMRLAVFKTGLESGLSDEQAASLAKNITVNFNKKGQISAQAGAVYAFFNANVQGTARLAETLFEPGKFGTLSAAGKRIIAGGVILGVIQAVGMALAGFDDDEPPEFVKSKSIIVPVPGTEKGYIAIPMPLGFNLIPNVGRLMAEALIHGKPGDKAYKFAATMLDTFSPMGSSATVLQTLAPTAVDPLVALSENKDWTGKSIYREDFNKLKPTPGFQRAKDSATPWSRGIAEIINYASGGSNYVPGTFSPSPDAIDYLISQATGGVGRETSKLSKLAAGLYTGEDTPLHTVPLIGRLAGSASSPASIREEFYRNLKTLNEEEAEVKGRRAHGEPMGDYLLKHPEVRLAHAAEKLQRDIDALQKRKREMVQRGASRDAVKLIDERITAMMTRLNERMALK